MKSKSLTPEEQHIRDTYTRESWPGNDERGNWPLVKLAREAQAEGLADGQERANA